MQHVEQRELYLVPIFRLVKYGSVVNVDLVMAFGGMQKSFQACAYLHKRVIPIDIVPDHYLILHTALTHNTLPSWQIN